MESSALAPPRRPQEETHAGAIAACVQAAKPPACLRRGRKHLCGEGANTFRAVQLPAGEWLASRPGGHSRFPSASITGTSSVSMGRARAP